MIEVEDRLQDCSPNPVLPIEIIAGDVAPRYPITTPNVKVTKVVITERGTASELPIVDLQLVDHDGKPFFTCLTGRHVAAIAAAIRGINVRNHGKENP